VPRDSWEALFRAQGMQKPISRIRMLDGFNEGWIEFNDGAANSHKGTTELQTVVDSLV
jgi:NAD(P)H dehydrogenase (quinone)